MNDRYLRERWEYNNNYDRDTITELKALEQIALLERQRYQTGETSDDQALKEAIKTCERAHAYRYENKERIIDLCMDADRSKDRLIATTPVPKNIRCHTCGRHMTFETYTFKNNDRDILFFFSCPERHIPKRLVYANGFDFPVKVLNCPKCGGNLYATQHREGAILYLNDTCGRCGYTDTLELDETPEQPIDEEERQRYCLTPPKPDPEKQYLKEVMSFLEFLDDLVKGIERRKAEAGEDPEDPEQPKTVKIKTILLAELENCITTLLEKNGFLNIRFDKPQIGDTIQLSLTAYENLKGSELSKTKLFKKTLKDDLLRTNWRLDGKSVSYRLGCFSATLTGYDKPQELNKLAWEAGKKTAKNKSPKRK